MASGKPGAVHTVPEIGLIRFVSGSLFGAFVVGILVDFLSVHRRRTENHWIVDAAEQEIFEHADCGVDRFADELCFHLSEFAIDKKNSFVQISESIKWDELSDQKEIMLLRISNFFLKYGSILNHPENKRIREAAISYFLLAETAGIFFSYAEKSSDKKLRDIEELEAGIKFCDALVKALTIFDVFQQAELVLSQEESIDLDGVQAVEYIKSLFESVKLTASDQLFE